MKRRYLLRSGIALGAATALGVGGLRGTHDDVLSDSRSTWDGYQEG